MSLLLFWQPAMLVFIIETYCIHVIKANKLMMMMMLAEE